MDLADRVKSTVSLVFPGQGSQYVGMGRDIYEASEAARRIFHTAEEVVGFGLRKLIFEGPAAELNDTANAQPALLTTSVAILEALREKWDSLGIRIVPQSVAGHSLGEYTALVAAGAISFQEAVRLVQERGRLMKESGVMRPGGMAAVIGLDDKVLERLCENALSHGIVCPANYNGPGQTVISGEIAALAAATQLAAAAGARRIVQLAVSIAAHSPVMQAAAEQFAAALSRFGVNDASVPIISNVSAQAITSAEEIRAELEIQITRSVRWAQSVSTMVGSGVNTVVEVGPGQVLSGLVKRINPEIVTFSISDLKSLEQRAPKIPEILRRNPD